MKSFYVYILRCIDDTFYIGVTNNLDRRISEHSNGLNNRCYTYKRRPIIVCATFEFNDINYAIAFEKQIKRWSRAKKEALIKNDYDLISKLAQRYSLGERKNDDGSSASP